MDAHNRQKIGKHAELYACRFLEKQGFRLLEQNYRCYHGEIDLIMLDQEDIVFIEVRSRKSTKYGNALESINRTKIRKIIKTATDYLQKKKLLYKVNSRFDVIAIHPVAGKMQLEWFKNAFSVES